MKPNGIEVRIGGGGTQTQSVMPPSIHHSGRAYQWQPGFGLDEVEIAAVPDNMMEVILEETRRGAANAGGTLANGRRSTAILRGTVGEGGRNDALFRFACLLSSSIAPADDRSELDVLDVLRAVNTTRCRPPLPDAEVVSVFRSAVKYRREDMAAEALFPGVEAVVEGARTVYRPAGLELTIHQGDPTMFALRCEELRPFNPAASVRVPAEVWGDARKMKLALIAAFPGVPFDRHPGDFVRIWDGTAPRVATKNHSAREAVTGLRVLLEQEAIAAGRRVEVTDPAENAARRLVSYFVGVLDRWDERGPATCETRKEDVERNEIIVERCGKCGGWVHGEMVFVWKSAWSQIEQSHRTERSDQAKLAATIREVIGRELTEDRLQFRGKRYYYRHLSSHEVELLRVFAAGGCGGGGC